MQLIIVEMSLNYSTNLNAGFDMYVHVDSHKQVWFPHQTFIIKLSKCG